jgi:hypothetical protein
MKKATIYKPAKSAPQEALSVSAVGYHNTFLNKATDRIMTGATWKKQRIIVVLPAGDMISTRVALSHWGLIFPPNQGVIRFLAEGLEVGEAYSNTISHILEHPELST